VNPCVSVLLPAYNAQHFIRESVNSVLAQTFTNFELIVVNDGSDDSTSEILTSIREPRLRIIDNQQNLGIVGALNRGIAAARGRYIARIDADDFCLPTRLDRQKRFLDSHPNILLVGSEMFNLQDGRLIHDPRRGEPDPLIIRWLFNVENPVGHPSVMFRAEVVSRLGCYMRKEFEFCEDFDFSHRVLLIGDIATMPEQLGIYRRHPQSLTHTRKQQIFDRVTAVLQVYYEDIFGKEAKTAAPLVALHFMGASPVRDADTLAYLGSLLDRLMRRFLATHQLTPQQERRVVAHAAGLWWRTVQTSLQGGSLVCAARARGAFSAPAEMRPPFHRLARSALCGLIPRRQLGATLRRLWPPQRAANAQEMAGAAMQINGLCLRPALVRRDNPPVLYVVVDWIDADVEAVRFQDAVQAVLDKYGARPVYLVTAAIADQPQRTASLQRVLERGGCAIGVSTAIDAVGNCPEDAELSRLYKQSLQSLNEAIQQRFGVAPSFVEIPAKQMQSKIIEVLRQLGFSVIFNNLEPAGSDSRHSAQRQVKSTPYWIEPHGMLLLSTLDRSAGRGRRSPPSGHRPVVRAEPELPAHFDAAQQIALVRSMIRRGYRTFTFRCHAFGHTADGASEIRLLDDLCRFFFEETGGMPGNPADLVPSDQREHLLPNAPAQR
jgi:hypothetical protein